MSIPDASTHDFLDENVDNPDARFDADVGPPREPRWGQKKQGPGTLASQRAVAEKKLWQERRASLGEVAEVWPSIASLELVSAHVVAMAVGLGDYRHDGRDPRVLTLAMRILGAFAVITFSGIDAIAVPVLDIGREVGASWRRTRLALRWLEERRLLEAVPTFERHGAASSRRATAYIVVPWVLEALSGIASARIALPFLKQHPERILPAGGLSCESPPSMICSQNALPPPESSPAAPAAGVVSASPIVRASRAMAPADCTDDSGPDRRQGENCEPTQTAPDAEWLEHLRQSKIYADGAEVARNIERARRLRGGAS